MMNVPDWIIVAGWTLAGVLMGAGFSLLIGIPCWPMALLCGTLNLVGVIE